MRNLFRWTAQAVAILVLTGILGACKTNWMKEELKQHKVTVLSYPRGDMVTGSYGWGNPGGEVIASRDASQVLNDVFLNDLTDSGIAWKNRSKGYNTFIDLDGAPGPAILENVSKIGLSAGVSLDRGKMKFLQWGDMTSRSMNMQRLSEAIVRGWFNIPGESFSADGLLALRPDNPTFNDRPWFVWSDIATSGLRYGVDSHQGAQLRASAGLPTHGTGALKTGIEMKDSEILEVKCRMALGVRIISLADISPPLPTFESHPESFEDIEYTLSWRRIPSQEGDPLIKSKVRPSELLEFARRNSAETVLAVRTTGKVEEALRNSPPAPMSLAAEAVRPLTQAEIDAGLQPEWRPLQDGDDFQGNEIVRLRVQLPESAALFVLAKDNTGQAAVLYPAVEGESLSRGSSELLPAGEWRFPESVLGPGQDGMTFNPNDPPGTESFVVIATKEPAPNLAQALADFAREARQTATANPKAAATRDIALAGLTRLPVAFSSAAGGPTTSIEQTQSKKSLSDVMQFTGFGNATVLTLNLHRIAPAQ